MQKQHIAVVGRTKAQLDHGVAHELRAVAGERLAGTVGVAQLLEQGGSPAPAHLAATWPQGVEDNSGQDQGGQGWVCRRLRLVDTQSSGGSVGGEDVADRG